MHAPRRNAGFTLVELLVVIAIIGIIAVVGIRQFGTLRQNQAKKMNVSTIKHTFSALQTYDLVAENTPDRFDNFDSLVDIGSGNGPWQGPAGEYVFSGAASAVPGIYDGSWKRLQATYDAGGNGGSVADLETAKKNNKGITDSLAKILGIHYLTADEVTLLNNAGIWVTLLHNNSTAQAYGKANVSPLVVTADGRNAEGYRLVNGGPGFRPDMSAFYPAALTNGSPVAFVNPIAASSIYTDLGYDLGFTNNAPTEAEATAALASVGKLVCFGIGKAANCVRAKNGLGEAPLCNQYDRTYYRNYLAVFALKPGARGTPGTCALAGVLDADGNTYRAAQYNADWTLPD